jgi:hypothetical protein
MLRVVIGFLVMAIMVAIFIYFHGQTDYRHPKHQQSGPTGSYNMPPPGDPRGGR